MGNSFFEKNLTSESEVLSGRDIYYKCLNCGDVVHSAPQNAARCGCRNINIDADAGRISIKNYDRVVMLTSK